MKYWWVICSDGAWRGPYMFEERAEEARESPHDDIFSSDYKDLSKTKQAYREEHPNYRHKNFKAGVR